VGSRRFALSDWLGKVELPPATEIAFPSRLAARRTDASHWNQRKGREKVNLKCESDLRNQTPNPQAGPIIPWTLLPSHRGVWCRESQLSRGVWRHALIVNSNTLLI